MEYEMEDEARLFDDSTNPSLKRKLRPAPRTMTPRDRRSLQKGELIPEEEDQAA
jgi:hypothetical protein